jgi:cytochrome c peroxidase
MPAGERRRAPRLAATALLLAAGVRVAAAPAPAWEWRLPAGFPAPRVPTGNPMSEAKVALGRRLFHDRRLSLNETQACADCHRQERAFTDGAAHATGSTGAAHRRNVPTLANVAYAPALTWADPRHDSLEEQARVPLFGTDPVEMGFGGREEELVERLRDIPLYRDGFAAAFPSDPSPVTIDNLTRAIASFERTLVSGDSPYDRLVYGDVQDALTPQARRGMRLFFSDRTRCGTCHGGLAFAGVLDYAELPLPPRPRFLDDGLTPNGLDPGLEESTGRRRDRGRFKVPTLRNIALTSPYMHDGRFTTLDVVLDHYAQAGPDREPIALSGAERADLLAFLGSLTDTAFVSDPRFAAVAPARCDAGCSRSR